MSKPILGYWNIRGLGAAIRYMLTYSEIDYEEKNYELGDGPEFSRDAWLKEKFTLGIEFPNLPYLIDGEFSMTESIPIMKYIADQYKPELMGSEPSERANVNMLAGVVHDLNIAIRMPCYASEDKAPIFQALH